MDLEQQLTDAIRRLRTGLLKNEAQVKQSVILPVLRALGWNTDAPEQLSAEFPAGDGRVDYALLHYDQPQVFIEAKRIGYAEDRKAREQLFGYAANQGIPILVLTDGRQWDFYFGTGPGAWEDRCFRRLTLDDDQPVAKCAEFLTRHLGREAVVSGEARRSADRLLAESQAFERANRTMPEAWRTLLSEPDPRVRELLGEEVQSRCGVKPRADDVDSFLKGAAMAFRQSHSSSPTAGAGGCESFGPSRNARREVAEQHRFEASGRMDEPTTAPAVSERHATASKSRQGLKIPQGDFTRPILEVLVAMGGRGGRREVLDRVAEVMASRLGDHDRKTHKDGSVRWEKSAEFQCTEMRKIGLLKPVKESGVGRWEISEQGRAYWSERR